MNNKHIAIILSIVILCPASGMAKDKKGPEKAPRPAIFQKLVDCKSLPDAAARLKCYDEMVAQIDQAEASAQLVVVDKEQVTKARKSLFGLSLPNFNIFSGSDDDEEFQQIESTIKSVFRPAPGKWGFLLEDGAKWIQTDTASIRDPKPGQAIKIRKAAMGSFFANVGTQHAIRVKREN